MQNELNKFEYVNMRLLKFEYVNMRLLRQYTYSLHCHLQYCLSVPVSCPCIFSLLCLVCVGYAVLFLFIVYLFFIDCVCIEAYKISVIYFGHFKQFNIV